MSLQILEPGFLTTVQDLGRVGYQRLGIPAAGAMDPFAMAAANALVGNAPGAAALEITMAGPVVRFDEGCTAAVAGAELGPELDGREIQSWMSYLVRPGTTLTFSGRRSGARAYLAVSGGIGVEPWLGSRSTYLPASVGGHEGRALAAGDTLPIGRFPSPMSPVTGRRLGTGSRPAYSCEPRVRVILGPHADRFTDQGIGNFLEGSYEISPTSNRMGYRLDGPKITHSRGPDIISCGIPLGGIQVPGNGQPIILMADHQTTGGYTMIATVIQADIPLVAQCLPGERVRFQSATLVEAREALSEQREWLRGIQEEEEGILWII